MQAKLVRNDPQGARIAHEVGSVRRINERDAASLNATAYASTDHIGKLGVERFDETELLGQVGYDRV